MKKIALYSLILFLSPIFAAAQDDMYFYSNKKDAEEKVTPQKEMQLPERNTGNTNYGISNSNVVTRNANGRDVDEYNRQYSSFDNKFSTNESGDTLYIDGKKPSEYGEWVNGFNGSESDYEYAGRLVRFHNPRFAIPVGSSLYWDLVYGPASFDWNVYSDGSWAYAFPTWSNPIYFDYTIYGDWAWNFGASWYNPWSYRGWYNPWYYNSWYYPGWSWGWGGGWYAGYWGSSWNYGWYGGPYWGGGGWYADNRSHRARTNGYYWGNSGSGVMARRTSGMRGNYPDRSMGSLASSRGIANNATSTREDRAFSGNVIGNRRIINGDASNSRNVFIRGEATGNENATRGSSVNDYDVSSNTGVRRGGRIVSAQNNDASVRESASSISNGNGFRLEPVQNSDGNVISRERTVRSNSTFTRSVSGNSSTYTRPSSTRSTVRMNNSNSFDTPSRSIQNNSTSRSYTREIPSNNFSRSNSSSSFSRSSSSGSSFSSGSHSGSFSGGTSGSSGVRRGR